MAGKYHYTVSKGYCNIESDTVDDLKDKIRDFVNDDEIPELLDAFASTVAGIGGGKPTMQQAVQNVTEAMPGSQVISEQPQAAAQTAAPTAAPEVMQNAKGTQFTYNHPEAPMTQDGRRMVLMEGRGAKGPFKGWVDPTKGPKPTKPVDDPEKTRWL